MNVPSKWHSVLTVCHKLSGDDPAGIYARLIEFATSIASVEDAELPGSVNGDCTHELHRVRVEISNSPAQRVKTLAHEIGHALLHEGFDNRALAELEAESAAYVICQALNLDTSDYSFGYVAGPEVANRPSPGSKDRASESRRLQHPYCSPSRSNRSRRHEPPRSQPYVRPLCHNVIMTRSKAPQYHELMRSTITTLKGLLGSATVQEMYEEVVADEYFAEEQQAITTKDGRLCTVLPQRNRGRGS